MNREEFNVGVSCSWESSAYSMPMLLETRTKGDLTIVEFVDNCHICERIIETKFVAETENIEPGMMIVSVTGSGHRVDIELAP